MARSRIDLVYGIIGGELLLAVGLGSLWAARQGDAGLILAALPQAAFIALALLIEWRQARRPVAGRPAAIARPAAIVTVGLVLAAVYLGGAALDLSASGEQGLTGALLLAGIAGLGVLGRPAIAPRRRVVPAAPASAGLECV